MIEDILKEAENRMSQTIFRLGEELKKVRTGRAQSSLVENIKVAYYGTETPLRELALITIPKASLIQIKPFDRNSIGDIELAIRNADLGINPINDGNFIRVALPPMTEERRIELVKQIKKIGEETKVSLRNIRGESWAKVQNLIKNDQATEDDKYQSQEELNKLIEKENSKVENIILEKEKEIMKI